MRKPPRRRIRQDVLTIDLEGREVPLIMRRNPRARRIILRLDPASDGAVVTLPPGAKPEEGLELARRKAIWLVRRLEALPPRVPFADGAEVPVLGVDHRVVHSTGRRGVVWRQDGEIHVAGRPEHLARRLADWFRREARRQISPRAGAKAGQLGVRPGRISLRDTRSRWGSCSSEGALSFCWRLVMAPEFVLDYVVAHEVAHLKFADHGPRFWRTVASLTGDVETARAWLHSHTERLHRYG